MSWDQIENKWAAMTHRVRPDWPASATVRDVYPRQGDDVTKFVTGATDAPVLSDAQASAAAALLVE